MDALAFLQNVLKFCKETLVISVYALVVDALAGREDANACAVSEASGEEVANKLRCVSELFDQADEARNKFVNCFLDWKQWRVKTIEELKRIAKRMRSDRFAFDVSKLVGATVGAAGGLTAGTMIFPPVGLVVGIVGGVISGVGCLTLGTALIVEKVRLNKNIKSAHAAREEDQTRFMVIKKWLEVSEKLEKAILNVIDIDVLKIVAIDVKEYMEQKGHLNEAEQEKRFRAVIRKCVETMCSEGKLHIQYGAELAPIVMTFILVHCLMNQINRNVFGFVFKNFRFGTGVLGGLKFVTGVGLAVAEAAIKAGGPIAARIVAVGFVGVGLAFDVLTIVKKSIDIHKGSLSEDAELIEKLTDNLELELQFLEEMFTYLIDSS